VVTALTAAGQRRRLLIRAGKTGGPVRLAALKAWHADLGGDDVARGVARLAMTGMVAMRRGAGCSRWLSPRPGRVPWALARRTDGAGWRTQRPIRRAAAARITMSARRPDADAAGGC
jgi:hypothetical protein